jgi:hypothetical protein
MRTWSSALLLAAVVAFPAPAAAADPLSGARHHRASRPAPVPIRPVLPALATGTAAMIARYNFDRPPPATTADDSGHGHTLHTVAASGGFVRRVVHGRGAAIAFPPECVAWICPHVALRSPSSADLNPGTRDIAFGADVLLPPGQTSTGENIVQKGYSLTSSQWKLQVDGAAGRPSCVLVDDRWPTIRIAYSSISIADGRWHALQCRRAGTTLAIFVDGVARGRIGVPSKLSVTNRRPLSIGGKGAFADNDQFDGALDNVWVQIG